MLLHLYRRSQPSGLGKGVDSGVFCSQSLSLEFLQLRIQLLCRLRSEVAEIGRGWEYCFGGRSRVEIHGIRGAQTSWCQGVGA